MTHEWTTGNEKDTLVVGFPRDFAYDLISLEIDLQKPEELILFPEHDVVLEPRSYFRVNYPTLTDFLGLPSTLPVKSGEIAAALEVATPSLGLSRFNVSWDPNKISSLITETKRPIALTDLIACIAENHATWLKDYPDLEKKLFRHWPQTVSIVAERLEFSTKDWAQQLRRFRSTLNKGVIEAINATLEDDEVRPLSLKGENYFLFNLGPWYRKTKSNRQITVEGLISPYQRRYNEELEALATISLEPPSLKDQDNNTALLYDPSTGQLITQTQAPSKLARQYFILFKHMTKGIFLQRITPTRKQQEAQ